MKIWKLINSDAIKTIEILKNENRNMLGNFFITCVPEMGKSKLLLK